MLERIKEALFFFRGNIIPICLIVLPFVLPLNIFSGLFYSYAVTEETKSLLFRHLPTIIALFVYPVYTGALIWYFSRTVFLDDWKWNLRECLSAGIRFWPQLLTVSVFCFMMILLGFLAFIIPGLILIARFSFAEFFVVVEGDIAADAIKRSIKSTKPFQKDIIGAFMVLFVAILGIEWGLSYLLREVVVANLIILIAAESFFALLRTILDVLFFRFYCLARETMQIFSEKGDPS